MPKSRSRGKATRRLKTVTAGAGASPGQLRYLQWRLRSAGPADPVKPIELAERPVRFKTDAKKAAGWVSVYKITLPNGCSVNGRPPVLFREGKISRVNGALKMCYNGLHSSVNPLHALFSMCYLRRQQIALWKAKADPKGRINERSNGIEKSVSSALYMERKLTDEERDEKLTGWVEHTFNFRSTERVDRISYVYKTASIATINISSSNAELEGAPVDYGRYVHYVDTKGLQSHEVKEHVDTWKLLVENWAKASWEEGEQAQPKWLDFDENKLYWASICDKGNFRVVYRRWFDADDDLCNFVLWNGVQNIGYTCRSLKDADKICERLSVDSPKCSCGKDAVRMMSPPEGFPACVEYRCVGSADCENIPVGWFHVSV